MAMSLVASTRGVALLPVYAQNFLPWSVIKGPPPLGRRCGPTIDLVIGYSNLNTSPIFETVPLKDGRFDCPCVAKNPLMRERLV